MEQDLISVLNSCSSRPYASNAQTVFTENESPPEPEIVAVSPSGLVVQAPTTTVPPNGLWYVPHSVSLFGYDWGAFCTYQELTSNEPPAGYIEAAYGVADEVRGVNSAGGEYCSVGGGTSEWIKSWSDFSEYGDWSSNPHLRLLSSSG